MWQRVYTSVRGPWSPSYERRYQELRRWVRALGEAGPSQDPFGPDGQKASSKAILSLLHDFDQLRFGRLVHQLENVTPAARVAHNWFVYDLDAAELHTALEGPLRR